MNESEVERLLRSTVLEPAPGTRPAPSRSWKVPVVAAGLFMAAAVLLAVLRPPGGPVAVAGKNRSVPSNAPAKPVRVLYVESVPRFEYRFLKNALLRDPSVLVQVLLTTADDSFPREHTASDDPAFREPIKEFPRDLSALLEFNVLILGDVDLQTLGSGAADRIVRYVEDASGGIIFLSGTKHNPRSYAQTPLARLLPVVAAEESSWEDDIGGWAYRRTADGQSHPITNLMDLQGGDGKGLPQIRWFQRIQKLSAGATALLEYSKGGTAHPLLVVSRSGCGRVIWSATDETWLWRLNTGDAPVFYPFWQRTIDWARGGP